MFEEIVGISTVVFSSVGSSFTIVEVTVEFTVEGDGGGKAGIGMGISSVSRSQLGSSLITLVASTLERWCLLLPLLIAAVAATADFRLLRLMFLSNAVDRQKMKKLDSDQQNKARDREVLPEGRGSA